MAATGGYGELVAAVLPCFWLYADIGTRLAPLAHADHPYGDWLTTYGDPAFAESTRTAIAIADRVAATASAGERERMTRAFTRSMDLEAAFFEAPLTSDRRA